MDKIEKMIKQLDAEIAEAQLELDEMENTCENYRIMNPHHEDGCNCREYIEIAMCKVIDLERTKERILKALA